MRFSPRTVALVALLPFFATAMIEDQPTSNTGGVDRRLGTTYVFHYSKALKRHFWAIQNVVCSQVTREPK
jgi:hypothetical protein